MSWGGETGVGRSRARGGSPVAGPRLAIDARTLGVERLDIAIERAQRHAKLLRQRRSADRKAMPPKELDQIKQSLRAGQGRWPSEVHIILSSTAADCCQHKDCGLTLISADPPAICRAVTSPEEGSRQRG